MAEARKAFELQAQVRQNASEYKNAINDLYSWEKDIKIKEQQLKEDAKAGKLKTPSVRTQCNEPPQLEDNKVNEKQGKNIGNRETINKLKSNGVMPNVKTQSDLERANEHKERGNKQVKLGAYKEAILEYNAAIDICPNQAIFYSNRAFCYLKLECFEECICDCDHAIKLDKLNVKAHYRRMLANESLCNNLDALKDCTSVLSIEPKNAEAKKSLERINARLRKSAKPTEGPNFSTLSENYIEILPIEKPPCKRSSQPLRRIPVTDVISSKEPISEHDPVMKITDEELDKLFNSNCGPYVEVKKESKEKTNTISKKTKANKNVESSAKKSKELKALAETIKIVEPTERAAIAKELNNEQEIPTTSLNAATVASNAEETTRTANIKQEKKAVAKRENNIFVPKTIALPPPPTSTAEFYTNWKELTCPQKYDYLKSIQIRNLCKMLGAGFDSETLSDVLQTLHDFYLPNKESSTAQTLLEISKNHEVGILSLLMSTKEKQVLVDILAELKKVPVNAAVITIIQQNFNVK